MKWNTEGNGVTAAVWANVSERGREQMKIRERERLIIKSIKREGGSIGKSGSYRERALK